MLTAGTMLQDRYEILEKIGSGGMSDVYKARCHKLNRLVAIKVLKAEFIDDATFVGKFKMEAQAAAALSHPNIVNIYDVVDEGDLHFIVMELVEGITLKSYIRRKGHLDTKEAIGIAIQVAQGIQAAHEQHIIHRDIKPQNMLISVDGKVKVADFGIARAVSSQTMNATVVGSVHYISPEQARGGFSDERSDIYSLGITMYEMVTGRVPFSGDNTVAVALAHLEDPVPLPSLLNPDITPSFERIILKCTEKRPENRYQNIGGVISDLRRALLDPDDQTVGEGVREHDPLSDTITIGKKELEMIQGRAQNMREPQAREQAAKPAGAWTEAKPAREIVEYGEPRPEKNKRPGSQEAAPKRSGKKGSDDEATQLEKLLTVLGVVAAIIVVAVVIFFLSRVGGLLGGTRTTDAVTTAAVSQAESGTDEPESDEETQTASQKEVKMPGLVGDTQEEAEAKLRELDLDVSWKYENSDTVEKGVILSQENPADSIVPRYSKVTLTVSDGSDKVDLSALNLPGLTLETAVRLLEGKQMKTSVTEESSETVESGTVIRIEPADQAPIGSTVTIFVSTGPEIQTVPMPGIEGKTETEALALLSEAGLVPGQVSKEYDDEIPAGSIISQEVPMGQDTELGATVDYTVSLGPETPQTQFLASLNVTYPLTVSYGPGAATSEIQILIRLKQTVNGKTVYTKLAEPKSYTADTTLEIKLDNIRGADGVTTGEVEIVDLTNNVVLTSYNVTFTETQV